MPYVCVALAEPRTPIAYGGTIAGLRIILPKKAARAVAHRCGALDSRLSIHLYEHEPMLNVLQKIDPKSAGNVDSWMVPARAPPLVCLVAPALRFHRCTDEILKFLSPELEVVRVGLAESWRRGLRMVMRQ